MQELDKFKKLPKELRKLIVKELIPKYIVEGLEDDHDDGSCSCIDETSTEFVQISQS